MFAASGCPNTPNTPHSSWNLSSSIGSLRTLSFTGLSRWGTKRTGLAPTLQRSENTPLRRVLPWWGHHPMVPPISWCPHSAIGREDTFHGVPGASVSIAAAMPDDKEARIVDARMKLRERFHQRMRNTPATSDEKPLGRD